MVPALAAHAQAVAPTPAPSPATAAAPEKRLRLSGDVGLRSEYMRNEAFASSDATQKDDHRLRWRARLRFGGEYDVGKSIVAGWRLSTGDNSYPASAWSSFSDQFRRDLIQVDRAYVNWQVSPSVQLRLGAQANPLFTPTEMVWDTDVQPAGLAEVLKLGRSGLVLTAGQYMLRELRTSRPTNDENSFLFANGFTYAPTLAGLKLTVGLSHYAFTNPDVVARSIRLGELDGDFRSSRYDPRGRTLTGTPPTPIDYFSGFRTVNASLRLEGARAPWSLVADVALNTSARADATLGPAYADKQNLAAGGMLGYRFTKNKWEVAARAGYFHIEADSVLAAYNSDDLQQTNVDSVPVDVTVRLPSGARLVWDTYIQRRINVDIPSAGAGHRENATKVRSRLTVSVSF